MPSNPKPKKRSVPVHPDVVKAAVLAAYDSLGTRDNYAIRRAAEVCHVPESTVRSWLTRGNVNQDSAQVRITKRADIADRLEDLAHRIIDTIPNALPTAPVNQLAVALGITIDKRLLLLGQPTAIGVSVNLSPEQRARRLDEIFARHAPSEQVEDSNDTGSKAGD